MSSFNKKEVKIILDSWIESPECIRENVTTISA